MCFQLQLLNTFPKGRAVSDTVLEGPGVMVLGCADSRPAAELLGRRCLHLRTSQATLDICKVMIVLKHHTLTAKLRAQSIYSYFSWLKKL